MKTVLKFFFLLAALVSIISSCTPDRGLSIGERVADFRLDTLNHERFYLNRCGGKVVVLVFWTTWCRYCKTQMAELQSFSGLPGWQDVIVAAVCTDPENLSDVKNIVRHLKIAYPVLLDHEARLFGKYGLGVYPTTMIIDKQRRLQFSSVGYDPVSMGRIETKVISLKAASGDST